MSSSISASPMEFLCLREVEYYGMTPYAVVDAIGQIIVQEVQNTFSKSAEQLHRHITFLSQAQIQTGMDSWYGIVSDVYSRLFDKFEAYLMDYLLMLPDQFILPHHRQLDRLNNISVDETEGLISGAVSALKKAKLVEDQLQNQEAILNEHETHITYCEEQFNTIKACLDSHNIESLEKAITLLAADLSSLKMIVMDTIEASRNALSIEQEDIDTGMQSFHAGTNVYQQYLCEGGRLPQDLKLSDSGLSDELSACLRISNVESIKAALSVFS